MCASGEPSAACMQSLYLQLYLHQRASFHPSVEVPVPSKSLDDSAQDALALGFIQKGVALADRSTCTLYFR
jgi:hypothetical protein